MSHLFSIRIICIIFILVTLCACSPSSETQTMPTLAVLPTLPVSSAATAAPEGAVNNAVQDLFTQTAVIQQQLDTTQTIDAMFKNAATGTAAFQATVAQEFQQAVLATAQAAGTAPTVPVAFSPEDSANQIQLNLINSDGSNLRTIYTTPGKRVSGIRFAPDGQKIAFVETLCDEAGDCNWTLSIIDINGTGYHQLRNHLVGNYIWSPDSQSILTFGLQKLNGDESLLSFDRIAIDTGTAETIVKNIRITSLGDAVFAGQFTPDGTALIYMSGDKRLYLQPVNGSAEIPISPENVEVDTFVDWIAPAQTALYKTYNEENIENTYWLQQPGQPALELVRASYKVEIDEFRLAEVAPMVAPDGKMIAVAMQETSNQNPDDRYKLLVYDLNGAKLHEIPFTYNTSYVNSVFWSQDSRYIVIQAGDAIFMFDLQTDTGWLLAQGGFGDAYPWLPDARHLIYMAGDGLCTIALEAGSVPVCASMTGTAASGSFATPNPQEIYLQIRAGTFSTIMPGTPRMESLYYDCPMCGG